MQKNYSGNVNFYPRPPRGGRPYASLSDGRRWRFLSTPSARRATKHRERGKKRYLGFLSTPSARRATPCRFHLINNKRISIHALREEGDVLPCIRPPLAVLISIHALREEGDSSQLVPGLAERYFYPRPPRGGRRRRSSSPLRLQIFLSTPSARRATFIALPSLLAVKFLSTPSARRATYYDWRRFYRHADFYPRPPRGGRHQ